MKNKKLNKEKAIQCDIRCKSLKWMKWGSVPMCASLNTEHMHPTEAFTPSAAYVKKPLKVTICGAVLLVAWLKEGTTNRWPPRRFQITSYYKTHSNSII